MTKQQMFGGNFKLISIIMISGKGSVQQETVFALGNVVAWLGHLSILLMSLRSWSAFKIAKK